MLLILYTISFFSPFEWTEYKDYRYIQSIDIDTRWVWVASTNGLIVYDKLRQNWEIPPSRAPFPDGIKIIGVDPFSNYIWFATRSILAKYNTIAADFTKYSLPIQGIPSHIAFTKEEVFLKIGKYYRFDRYTEVFEKVEGLDLDWKPRNRPQDFTLLSPYFVQDRHLTIFPMTCVVLDQRFLWVGTAGMGLYKYDIYTHMSENIHLGIPGGRVQAVYVSCDTIWIGGDNDVLTLWDRGNQKWRYFEMRDYGLYSIRVSEIVSCSLSVWVATSEGLVSSRNGWFKTFTMFDGLPSNNITAIEIHNNELWVGTDRGLARLVRDMVINERTLKNRRINDLEVAGDTLFIATPYGVVIRERDEFSVLPDTAGILATGVSVMSEGRFFATRLGIEVIGMRSLTYPVDLPSRDVYAITLIEDEVWIGTGRGVVKFDKTLSLREIFDEGNSPIRGAVYAISVYENSILFGTDAGLIEYKGDLR